MKTNAPTQLTAIIALVLALVALISVLAKITFLGQYAFWILLVGFCLLFAGCILKKL